MSDLITTLHPINDNNTDLYPNIKRDNLPQNVKDELDAIPNKVDKVQGKGLSTNDFTNADKALVDTIPNKVDKVTGKGLSTNDYTNADKALVDTIPDKVNKEQGKGLSTNDFTNEYKKDLDQDIPDQIQLFKDAFEDTAIAINGKVDKVQGKGLSTNDFTNADKALVDSIPDKVDKVQGKGLSTNDYTNADKSYLDNLPNYFISIASGGVVDVENPSSTPYFGAKHGTTSNFLLRESQLSGKVTGSSGANWSFIMTGNANFAPTFTLIIPPSGVLPSQVTQYKLPLGITTGSHELALRDDLDSLLTEVPYTKGEHANVYGKIYRFKDILFFNLNMDFYGVSDPDEVLLTINLPFKEGDFGMLVTDNEGEYAVKHLSVSWSDDGVAQLTLNDLQVNTSHDVCIQGCAVVSIH